MDGFTKLFFWVFFFVTLANRFMKKCSEPHEGKALGGH